eukprot:TRINITY_DN3964_c0_g1_i1.p1 TRINITY_DN3964_c0_g1~~TRINITY_DN3964_c0_g1_i1.p1  ORF type:complete len:164 (+),score=67.65 TRINITY_DN3964_c0_g1_i1:133-624(+)
MAFRFVSLLAVSLFLRADLAVCEAADPGKLVPGKDGKGKDGKDGKDGKGSEAGGNTQKRKSHAEERLEKLEKWAALIEQDYFKACEDKPTSDLCDRAKDKCKWELPDASDCQQATVGLGKCVPIGGEDGKGKDGKGKDGKGGKATDTSDKAVENIIDKASKQS